MDRPVHRQACIEDLDGRRKVVGTRPAGPTQGGTWTKSSDNRDGGQPKRLTRRELLVLAGAGGAAAAAGYLVIRGAEDDTATSAGGSRRPPTPTAETGTTVAAATAGQPAEDLPTARWSDPATWGGEVPGEGDVAVVDHPILLDVDARVAGVEIGPEGDLCSIPRPAGTLPVERQHHGQRADPAHTRRPRARPCHPVRRRRREPLRRGSYRRPVRRADVGLWVLGAGILDLQGTPKTSWTNLTGAADRGDRTITVDEADGWQVGDEIVDHPDRADDRRRPLGCITIAGRSSAVDGNRVELEDGLGYDHPTVTVRPGVTHRAEVLNLTRNVLIQGTPGGPVPRPAAGHHPAPEHRATSDCATWARGKGEEEVLGRYALHFHADYDGSRGTVVEGVVAYDSTGHAFAAHLSDGVTFRDCIAHDMVDDAFWWDLSLEGGRDLVPSNEIVYERCVAHFVKSGGNSKFNLTGFLMGAGDGNIARGCVATGIQGGAESSAGFHWPSHSRNDRVWTFEDNIAHNNAHSGIYFWQNGAPRTIVDRFTAYHNDRASSPARTPTWCRTATARSTPMPSQGLIISALPARRGPRSGRDDHLRGDVHRPGQPVRLRRRDHQAHRPRAPTDRVTLVSGCDVHGRQPGPGRHSRGRQPASSSTTSSTARSEGNEFWLADDVPATTVLNVDGGQHGSLVVRRADQPGDARPEWNASVTDGLTPAEPAQSAEPVDHRSGSMASEGRRPRGDRRAGGWARRTRPRRRSSLSDGSPVAPGRPWSRLSLRERAAAHGSSPRKSTIRPNDGRASRKTSSLRTTRIRSGGKRANHRSSCSA